MDCAQHPGVEATAYCRSCGKALCELCKRDVQGAVFCEPCLAAKVNAPGGIGDVAGPAADYVPRREYERSLVGAVVLIVLGILFLLSNLNCFSFFWLRQYWPVILIVSGVWLFLRRRGGVR